MTMVRLGALAHAAGRILTRARREQVGLSMIEVMIAALLLVIGALAIFKLVDAAASSSYRAEQSQVTNNLLQRELERAKAAMRDDIAVDPADPGCKSDAPDFAQQFSSTGYLSTDPADGYFDERPWVTPPEGVTGFALCEQVTSGDVTATVFRAVSWFDPDLATCEPPATPSDAYEAGYCGMKRITIGVQPESTASGGDRGYREMQADVVAFEAGDDGSGS